MLEENLNTDDLDYSEKLTKTRKRKTEQNVKRSSKRRKKKFEFEQIRS